MSVFCACCASQRLGDPRHCRQQRPGLRARVEPGRLRGVSSSPRHRRILNPITTPARSLIPLFAVPSSGVTCWHGSAPTQYVWNVNNMWRKNRKPSGGNAVGIDQNRNYDVGTDPNGVLSSAFVPGTLTHVQCAVDDARHKGGTATAPARRLRRPIRTGALKQSETASFPTLCAALTRSRLLSGALRQGSEPGVGGGNADDEDLDGGLQLCTCRAPGPHACTLYAFAPRSPPIRTPHPRMRLVARSYPVRTPNLRLAARLAPARCVFGPRTTSKPRMRLVVCT